MLPDAISLYTTPIRSFSVFPQPSRSVALGLQFFTSGLGPLPVDRSRTMRAVAEDVVDGVPLPLGKCRWWGAPSTLIGAQRVLFKVYSVAILGVP